MKHARITDVVANTIGQLKAVVVFGPEGNPLDIFEAGAAIVMDFHPDYEPEDLTLVYCDLIPDGNIDLGDDVIRG